MSYKLRRIVVYDRNHLFGLCPIPKPKLKIWPKLSADTETNRNHKILDWIALYQGVCKKVSCQSVMKQLEIISSDHL